MSDFRWSLWLQCGKERQIREKQGVRRGPDGGDKVVGMDRIGENSDERIDLYRCDKWNSAGFSNEGEIVQGAQEQTIQKLCFRHFILAILKLPSCCCCNSRPLEKGGFVLFISGVIRVELTLKGEEVR